MMLKCLQACFLLILSCCISSLNGQPYFDVAGSTFLFKPSDGKASEIYSNTFLMVPLKAGGNNMLIPGLSFEYRKLDYAGAKTGTMQGISMPLTLLHNSNDSSYNFTVTFIGRFNSTDFSFRDETFQAGGAFVYTRRISQNLKVKGGLYYNREFFSDLYVPLVGIDWKINHKLNLFGLLPNSIRLERKFTSGCFSGIVFRSLTNSFRYPSDEGYYKIEDNHLGIYADFYLPARFTLTAEAGHTVFKRIKDRSIHNKFELLRDGAYARIGIFYRVRDEK